MEEQINELVDGDAIMHLELLEYMTDKFRTNHPTVSPDQQKLLALQVLAGVQQFIKDLKTMFKGRYPNAIRQDPQAVLAVAASKCTDVKGLAELLGTNYQKLLRGPCQLGSSSGSTGGRSVTTRENCCVSRTQPLSS